MRTKARLHGSRGGWWRFAMALGVVSLIVATQGCCCTKTCLDKIGTVVQNECREACEPTVIAGAFVFDEKPDPNGVGCIVVEPTKIKAGAGEGILFVNNSAVKLSVRASVARFFSIDDPLDLAPGETQSVEIRRDVSLAHGAIIGINVDQPPATKCTGTYPGPSIEFD